MQKHFEMSKNAYEDMNIIKLPFLAQKNVIFLKNGINNIIYFKK